MMIVTALRNLESVGAKMDNATATKWNFLPQTCSLTSRPAQ
jgi:hypothetical protein